MNRTRQIPAVDASVRERVLQQPVSAAQVKTRPNSYPYHGNYASVSPRKNTGGLLSKLRSENTQALLTNGCSSMRDFCANVQSITADLNNLLTSIENILPIVTGYLALTQPRETISLSPAPPESHSQTAVSPTPPTPSVPTPRTNTPPPVKTTVASTDTPLKQPRPEDIQQLLENPLVKNLLMNVMQNTNLRNMPPNH